MGDGFDHKKGVATPGRNAAAPEQTSVPGKRTQVQLCYESGPDLAEMMQRFRDRTPSALDQPRLDPEQLKRRIAEGIARAKEQIIGELPLGGWLAAPRGVFEEEVRKDERKIVIRTLDAATSTASGALAVAAGTARGESSILIMRRAEAAAVVEQVVMSLGTGVKPTEMPVDSRETAGGAPLEPQAHRPAAPAEPPTPTAPRLELGARTRPRPAPEATERPESVRPEAKRFNETEPIYLHPKPRTPTVKVPREPVPRPVYPDTKTGPAAGEKRKQKLVTDLKRRSVPTRLDGSGNPGFDIETPSHIVDHFKAEQARTQSNNPKKWNNPPGYDAQHPNGRRFADYGEPKNTRLHWGTVEDNRELQGVREGGGAPNVQPKPIPGNDPPRGGP
jgi:hypothetical protein